MNHNWSIIKKEKDENPRASRYPRTSRYLANYGEHFLGEFPNHVQAVAACKAVENFIYSTGASGINFGKTPGSLWQAEAKKKVKPPKPPNPMRGIRKQGRKYYITSPRGTTTGFIALEDAIEERERLLKIC